KNHAAQNNLLLIASLIFYAWGEPLFVFIMIACIGANYYFGRLVESKQSSGDSKLILTLMLIFNLGVLGIFKYSGFVISNLNSLFSLNFNVPEIALPIGISFFTFQGISYVIDVYRKKAEAFQNPLDVGLYISFFPQLIAGPIVRYETIAAELRERKATEDDFAQGIARFIIGIAKKVILANQFALIADKAYSLPPESISMTLAWMGAVAYMLQIYFDFSGYSDMAIGLGRLFGFHFPENFNSPYMAKSVSDFWRRWHISLSSWFKDYVYIPLGGGRVSRIKQIRNLALVWLCTGIWHGANWTFIVWGIYFGVLIIVEKFTRLDKYLERSRIIGHVYTIFIVLFGWILFRANSISEAFFYIKSMFGMNGSFPVESITALYLNDNLIIYIMGIISCLPIIEKGRQLYEKIEGDSCFAKGMQLGYVMILAAFFAVSASYLIKGTYNPFIYFNF
ncbi:MAG: MBOAT family protein, partial [Proteocatella sp.]